MAPPRPQGSGGGQGAGHYGKRRKMVISEITDSLDVGPQGGARPENKKWGNHGDRGGPPLGAMMPNLIHWGVDGPLGAIHTFDAGHPHRGWAS